MNRAGLIAGILLVTVSAAHATGEIVCSGLDGGVSILMLVSRSDTLNVLRTTITIGGENWSSDQSAQPGQPVLTGQAFENDGVLLVDFISEPSGSVIARLRAFSSNEDNSYASGGVFSINQKGAWVVDCSERG